jgi:hypothetical protein
MAGVLTILVVAVIGKTSEHILGFKRSREEVLMSRAGPENRWALGMKLNLARIAQGDPLERGIVLEFYTFL